MTNPLLQYINLYKANASEIKAHSCEALNALRDEALQTLESLGHLPERGEEDYEKTSVADMFAPDFGVNINRVMLPADVATAFKCGVPNLSSLLGLTLNDHFIPTETLVKNCPEGLTVLPLKEAAARFPHIVGEYYNKVACSYADASRWLNTLLAQDGIFIHVARGCVSGKPLQLVNLFEAPAPLLVFRRVLVVVEDGASLSVLKCDHTNPSSHDCLSSEVVEVVLGRNASLQWYDIEESNSHTGRLSQFYAVQGSASSLNVCATTLTNGVTRNEFRIVTEGEHTHTTLSAMAIGSGKQHVDNFSRIIHPSKYAHSNQLFKYVLEDDATGAFEGGIEVQPTARFVEAYQSNRNMLASDGARMHSKPQLLIYNDDVKCSHGSSTGQLNGDALFYMQTRGIPADEARRMLMQAFMVDVIERIELSPLRDRLRHMVERRFSGDTSCAGCVSCSTDTDH